VPDIISALARLRARPAEALARRRVTLGFLCGAIVLLLARPTAASLLSGAAVAALGEAIRIWAAGHLNKGREVTASGPYRWVAHPLYAGSSLIGAGVALASGSAAAAVLIALYLAATITAAIASEERHLRQAFGDRYDRYRGGDHDRGRRFSLARAIGNREHRTIAGWLAALLLLFLKATYNGSFRR
jgi:hypothetical protein